MSFVGCVNYVLDFKLCYAAAATDTWLCHSSFISSVVYVANSGNVKSTFSQGIKSTPLDCVLDRIDFSV